MSDNGDEHAQAGQNAHNRGDHVTAVAEFERALELGVQHFERKYIYTLLGSSYSELGRRDRAIECQKSAIALDPNYKQAWNNLGIIYFDYGEDAAAAECHRKAIEIDPEYSFAHASIAAILMHDEDPAPALHHLQEAIRIHPRMAVAHSNLALAYARSGRFTEARAAIREAIALGYGNWREINWRIENLEAFDGQAPSHCSPPEEDDGSLH